MRLYLLRRAQSQEATYALQLERRHGTRLPNLFRQPIGGCIISWRCRAVIPLGVESFNDICNSPLQRVRRRQLALCEYAVTARNCGGQRDRSNAATKASLRCIGRCPSSRFSSAVMTLAPRMPLLKGRSKKPWPTMSH